MATIRVSWPDGRKEEVPAPALGGAIEIGPADAPVVAVMPLYAPDGPTLARVVVRGNDMPGLVYQRDPGRPRSTGRGRETRERIDVYLSPEEAAEVDAARGDEARGAWARDVILRAARRS